MKSDTITFRVCLDFNETVSKLEDIFSLQASITRLNGVQLQYQKQSVLYVRSSAQIQLSKYAFITIIQRTKQPSNGLTHIFVELHGLNQYHKQGTPILIDLEKHLLEFINVFSPTLWRIEMPFDVALAFQEITTYFDDYLKPYTTTWESHTKHSTIATQFQIYDKTLKNDLDIHLTRLEMKQDYSRRRKPIIITSIEKLKELEEELYGITKMEFEKHYPNVYTLPYEYHTNSIQTQTINLLVPEILTINEEGSIINIQTTVGVLYFDGERLHYSSSTRKVAEKISKSPPDSMKILHKIIDENDCFEKRI